MNIYQLMHEVLFTIKPNETVRSVTTFPDFGIQWYENQRAKQDLNQRKIRQRNAAQRLARTLELHLQDAQSPNEIRVERAYLDFATYIEAIWQYSHPYATDTAYEIVTEHPDLFVQLDIFQPYGLFPYDAQQNQALIAHYLRVHQQYHNK